MFKFYDYQQESYDETHSAWTNGQKVPVLVLPTGAGKTVVLARIIKDHTGAACVIAHRQELLGQISLALAKNGVYHRVIGSDSTIRFINVLHMRELGKIFYHPNAEKGIAAVNTIVNRSNEWFQRCTLWIQDEGHHVLKANIWGKAVAKFTNYEKGLLVTATPERADGKGLGLHADGFANCLIVGPSMRTLITRGFLTDYRIFAPTTQIDYSNVKIGNQGDYTKPSLTLAVRKSKIIGDVVGSYTKFASGKLAVVFATDVKTAEEIAENFRKAGIPSAMVCGETPDKDRDGILQKFKNKQIQVLVNVDLFGEGFDLPAIECAIFARPTMSYSLFCQQFGRALRKLAGKKIAIIIDHVGNVARNGLPAKIKKWSLDRREARKSDTVSDAIPISICPECTSAYERIFSECPYCGFAPEPSSRSKPEFVDGDLTELSPEFLKQMRGEVEKIDMPQEEYLADMKKRYVPYLGQLSGMKRHNVDQNAQKLLRDSLTWWSGYTKNMPLPEKYRRFYFKFGIDILSAQALKHKEAYKLTNKIWEVLSDTM